MADEGDDDIPEPGVERAVDDEEATALVDAITELAADPELPAYINEYDSQDREYLIGWEIRGRKYQAWLTERFVNEVFGGLGRFQCN